MGTICGSNEPGGRAAARPAPRGYCLRTLLLRRGRADESDRPNPPIGWIRQGIEAIINILEDQLHLERHGGRTPAGLLTRVAAGILALCAAINLNQRLGLPSRELAPYMD